MAWHKEGMFYVPDGSRPWARTHASVPTVDVLSDQVWRIYYAARNDRNQCSISYIDVEAGNPRRILYEHDQPILPLGKLGTFDDAGMMPSSIVSHRGVKYLYYTGWNVRTTVPYHNTIGLAVSHDGGTTFQRYGEGPVLGLSVHEPYFVGTATVMLEGGRWRAWYASCTGWEIIDGQPEPSYHLKYAESGDGIFWQRDGIIAVDYKNPAEGGIVRASVLHEDGRYCMWYAYRHKQGYRDDRTRSYRIGYAESDDGVHWHRLDHLAGIDVSETGWDSEMIEYPCVVSTPHGRHLCYNGNGFGASGIGYAAWESTTR